LGINFPLYLFPFPKELGEGLKVGSFLPKVLEGPFLKLPFILIIPGISKANFSPFLFLKGSSGWPFLEFG